MTRRVQFQRSSVTGAIPESVPPGAPAFNWADKKMYVGGPGGAPAFALQRIDNWSNSQVYRARDFVIHADNLWRAKVDIPAGVGFRDNEWLQLTDTLSTKTSMRADNGVLEGGQVAMLDARTLSISAGTGVIVDRTDPDDVVVTLVEWGNFSRAFNFTGTTSSFTLSMKATGASAFSDALPILQSVPLASGSYNRSTGDMVRVWDSRIWTSHTIDMAEQSQVTLGNRVTKGLNITAAGAMTMAVAGGTVSARDVSIGDANPHQKTVVAESPVTFDVTSGSNGGHLLNQTSVPGSVYDNGISVVAIPAGRATVHRLYWRRDGRFMLALGQKTWTNLTEALLQFPEYIRLPASDGGWKDTSGGGNAVEIGAIAVQSGATDLTNTTTTRILQARYEDRYLPVDVQDLSNFYRLDGANSLTADLNMGGYALTGGDVDGTKATILPKVQATSGTSPTAATNELWANKADRKVFLGATPVSDRTEVYDPARTYAVGDTCFYSNVLHRCTSTTTGAFAAGNWQAIGASVDIGDAVVLNPTTAGRNTIDLTGQPAAKGLVVAPDASQTANLAEFGTATIDRYGMGRGSLGSVVIRVSQASHGFSAIGQPVAFDEPNWVPADASDPGISGKALAVVHRVVDANNFDVQFGGVVSGMEAGAFVGGSAIAGAPYYVSETQAGKLTGTAPSVPNRVDPVIVMMTSTTGVLSLTSGADTTIEGGTGNTTFTVSQVAHGFTAPTAIGKPVYLDADDGLWKLARADDMETVGTALIAVVVDANTLVLNVSGFISDVAPQAFIGDVSPSAGRLYYVSQTTAGKLTEVAPLAAENRNPLFLGLGATTGVVMPYGAEVPTAGLRGEQTLEGPVNVSRDIRWGGTAGTDHRLTDNDGGGNANIRFGHYRDTTLGLISPNQPSSAGSSGVQVKATVDSASIGKIEFVLLDNGSTNGDGSLATKATAAFNYSGVSDLPGSTSVVTRERGDARYLQYGAPEPITGDLNVNGAISATGTATFDGGLTVNGISTSVKFRAKFGSDALPSYSFDGEEGTGFWRHGVGSMSMNSLGVTQYRFEPDSSTLPRSNSIVTRGNGDGRYARVDAVDNNFLGAQTMPNLTVTGAAALRNTSSNWVDLTGAGSVASPALRLSAYGPGTGLDITSDPSLRLSVKGEAAARFTAPSDNTPSLIKTKLSVEGGVVNVGSFTGAGVSPGVNIGGQLYIQRNSRSMVRMFNTNNPEGDGEFGVDNVGYFVFTNTDGVIGAEIEKAGTTVSGAKGVITREKGDARYVRTTVPYVHASASLSLTGGSLSVARSYGCSIARTAVGTIRVSFNSNTPNSNYVVSGSVTDLSGTYYAAVVTPVDGSFTNSRVDIQFNRLNAATPQTPVDVNRAGFLITVMP